MKTISIDLTCVFLLCLFSLTASAQYGIFEATTNWNLPDSPFVEGTVEVEGEGIDAVYTLTAAGADFTRDYDEGFYVYKELTGSWTLKARVDVVEAPNNNAKIALMVREIANDPSSKNFRVVQHFANRVAVQRRTENAGNTAAAPLKYEGSNVTDPTGEGIWLRLTRLADEQLFVVEWSDDGFTWFFGESFVLEMPETVAWGLAFTSYVDGEVATAVATEVEITPPTGVVVQRHFSKEIFTVGDQIQVDLVLKNAGDETESISLSENFPFDWPISNVSRDGRDFNGGIDWDVDAPPGETVVSYTLTVPSDPVPVARFDGYVNIFIPIAGSSAIVLEGTALKVEIPFAQNAVILDGIINPGEYSGAYTETVTRTDTVPAGVILEGEPVPESESNMTFYAFHDSKSIYIGMDVDDPILDFLTGSSIQENDSIELMIDGNFSRLEDREDNQHGIRFSVLGDGSQLNHAGLQAIAEPMADGVGYHTTTGLFWNYGARPKADGSGYVVEHQLNKQVLIDSPERTLIGFDFYINDADGSGVLAGKWAYHSVDADGNPVNAWANEAINAILELGEGTVPVKSWEIY